MGSPTDLPEFTPALDWIAQQRDAMVQQLREWCSINTGSYHAAGLRRSAEVLRRTLEQLPNAGPVELLDVPPHEVIGDDGRTAQQPLGPALRCRRRDAVPGAPRVLFNIHHDTVYPQDSPFQTVSQPDASTLNGPGVADAKGGIAVMLTALAALERSPLAGRINWEVLINPDEEIGSPGSLPLLQEAAQRNDIGLVFEPCLPDGALVGGRRGSGTFTVVVHGRAAHVGRDPERGRNAIVALSRMIARISAPNVTPPTVTLNPGRVVGGGAANIVPDLAIARINARAATPADQEAVERVLADAVAQISAEEGFAAELHGTFTSPPKPLDEPTRAMLNHLTECAQALRVHVGGWRDIGGASDGNKLAAAGLPCVDSLGPRGGSLHSDQEYVLIDSLTQRAQLAALFLMRVAADHILIKDLRSTPGTPGSPPG